MRRGATATTHHLSSLLAALTVALAACQPSPGEPTDPPPTPRMAYQLQGYPDGELDALTEAPHDVAVIDLARDGRQGYFTTDEITRLRDSDKTVLAYFEIGSIEDFRPEFDHIRTRQTDLLLSDVPSWPGEHFVRYWDQRWWQDTVRPRLDRAMETGFDGVYLDTLIAYEQIDLSGLPHHSRQSLRQAMADLVMRIAEHAHTQNPEFLVFPQNAPELREVDGYVDAIDGIGMEDLFFLDTDRPCVQDYCTENLDHVRALRDAGKTVLAVDYAVDPDNVAEACRRYREEGFGGTVTTVDLDTVAPPCPTHQ
ncbi:endo alpha-1,4 polygalactosaminidase [Saccharomonospora cyanea]|uniref:Glycoside hydrolase, end-alpha-1,4-polygalactosaminidase n=1 Tax=Saccharomonospora cyanea NA-134 TaxID=882082 RepID=H5XGN2_9PSEU|nr:endo alpha-1,4 polygalactosaminidase [Saccharomonospora cyanea]EHR61575.1 glycoside hydrolase, end-alpha-1,4-polygalactosaminidase [Saccharomonospora cyanea NA-134]